MASNDAPYKPKDTIKATVNNTAIFGIAGLSVAAIQNTLRKQNVGAWGVITRGGGVIASFAAVGGLFEFGRLTSANLREKDDSYNTAIGGFLAGSVMGLRVGTTPAVLGYGAGIAIALSAYDYSGTLTGYKKDPIVDEFERKEALRKNRRRPIEETIAELGEGRGIKAPGYDERRRQRLKEKYDIDVPVRS